MQLAASSSSIERVKNSKPWKAPTIRTDGSTDELYELENHFILRLPEDAADKVIEVLEKDFGDKLRQNLSIKFEPDLRHVTVRLEKKFYHGKLMDLPCIIECLKTLDKKNFYKVANVSQIAIVSSEEDPKAVEEVPAEDEPSNPKKKDKIYQYPHGLTPPLKNVRKRRFRKTLKKKNMDAPELDRELKRLLRADMEATKMKWEVIEEHVEKANESSAGDGSGTKKTTVVLLQGSSEENVRGRAGPSVSKPREFCFSSESLEDNESHNDSLNTTEGAGTTILAIPEQAMGSDEVDALTAVVEDSRLSDEAMPTFKIPTLNTEFIAPDGTVFQPGPSSTQETETETPAASSTGAAKTGTEPSPPDTNQILIAGVEKALSEIVRKRKKMENEVQSLDNAFLKGRMQEGLDKLVEEEKRKREELNLLKGSD